MARTTVGMVRIEDNEIVYKSPRWIGLLFGLIGIGVVVGCAMGGVHRQHNGWVPFAVGGVLGLIGIIVWCYVEELTIDLIKRTTHRKKGFFLSPKIAEGTFQDFRGVRFARERRTSSSEGDSSSYTVWCVYLAWRDGDEVRLGEWRGERIAHNKLEEFSKKLQLPMIDSTGEGEVMRGAGEADVTFREKVAQERAEGKAAAEFPEPPPDLRIDYVVEGNEIHFTLPRAGFGCGALFLGGFALFWNGIVLCFLAALLAGNAKNAPPMILGLLFLGPFLAVGVGLLLGTVYAVRAQTHVLASPHHITSYATFLGKHWGIKTIPCDEIEEIGIHAKDEDITQNITIRSDRAALDVGADLRESDKQWLCDAIKAIVAA